MHNSQAGNGAIRNALVLFIKMGKYKMILSSLEQIKLSHGSGKGLEDMLQEIVLPELCPGNCNSMEDAYTIKVQDFFQEQPSGKLAFTTDSFVVQPLEFPGGDIGKLSVCGTVNDLAMMGAIPRLISVSLIIEEGFSVVQLKRILRSVYETCQKTDLRIACGDTKVVEKGKADGIFINTAGIGIVPEGRNISATYAKPGDVVFMSGGIGLHGIAILASRKNLHFASQAISDCAPLHSIVEELLRIRPDVHTLRDCTRGGCAAVLNEIAKASHVSILLNQEDIPIPDVVQGACSFLGMDPLGIACEGRFIAILPEQNPLDTAKFLAYLRSFPLTHDCAIIGRVLEKQAFPVMLKTPIGGTRLVDLPPGELLPRIC